MSSGTAALRGRLRRDAADPLLRSAYSLVLNVVVTSGLGFAFWIAAARMFPSATVGRDSALIAAMLTLSTICQLNLGTGILRFLPIVKLDPARVVLGSYALTGALTIAVATVFVLLAPEVAHNYRFLGTDAGIGAIYVGATALWGVFALQDSVLTALRRAPWVPLENATFGVLKIAALPVLLAAGSVHAVYVAWVIPMAMLVIPVNWLIFARCIPRRPPREGRLSPVERFGWRGLARFLTQDYLAAVFTQAAATMLPIVIVGLLGGSKSAYFYIPFTIVSAFDLLFVNVCASLTVEGAIAEERLPALARTLVHRFRFVLIGGVVLLVLAAGIVLLPFGSAYAREGAPVLRLLACASLFRAVVALYGGIRRVEGRPSFVLAVQAAIFAMVMTLTVVLGRRHGIEGVGAAWLIANAAAGCAAAPHVVRVLRRKVVAAA